MSKGRPDRERWEIYFLTILLATRPILLRGGLVFLVYAMASLLFALHPAVSLTALGLATFLLLLVYSDRTALYTARIGSWLATLWKGSG
jgi:hypothetical protein